MDVARGFREETVSGLRRAGSRHAEAVPPESVANRDINDTAIEI